MAMFINNINYELFVLLFSYVYGNEVLGGRGGGVTGEAYTIVSTIR